MPASTLTHLIYLTYLLNVLGNQFNWYFCLDIILHCGGFRGGHNKCPPEKKMIDYVCCFKSQYQNA